MDDYETSNFGAAGKLIALSLIPGLGRKKISRLLKGLKKWEDLEISVLLEVGLQKKILKENCSGDVLKGALEQATSILESCDRFGIKVISRENDAYPKSLHYDDGPLLLYYIGNIDCLNHPKRAAVIGSRNPGQMGYDFSYQVAAALATQDVAVISGLATGCDRAGHQGALSKKGLTAAFLPSGLLNIYPYSNRQLAEEIVDHKGCLISEYPPDAEAKPYRFIERDRLQAAASQMIVTSLFSENGGTIHTLKYANKLNRPIYTGSKIFKMNEAVFRKLQAMGISCQVLEIPEITGVFKQF